MAYTYEYRQNIFWIIDSSHVAPDIRATYPKDAQEQTSAPLMGYNRATGTFIPADITSDGKLAVDATFSGTITLGAIKLQDYSTADAVHVSSAHGLSVDDNPLFKVPLTSDFTLDGDDDVTEIVTYPTGAGVGDPAIITTFTYDGDKNVTSISDALGVVPA